MSVDALNAALSGLRAAQRHMSLISANIANATTPGYTRKILPQTDTVVGGESLGVTTGVVTRQVNSSLQFDLFGQTSLASTSSAQLKYLHEIQLFHGDPNDESSITNMLQGIKNSFIALGDNPNDPSLQFAAVGGARAFATRVNDLSNLYTRQRNDVQTDMQTSINTINSLLQQIANNNEAIVRNSNTGRSTAELEDQRDQALTSLSEQMDISYFKTGEGRLVVQTEDGEALVDNLARTLVFNPSTLGVASAYPASAAGIYIDNPSTAATQDLEITQRALGGRLGGLLELRDTILPRYQAELDEMAQKVAQRFDEQGLTLFTDVSGNVPASVTPPTVTGYTGFSQQMQVNSQIISDPTLLQRGTTGETVAAGSNKIIERVVNYTFGLNRGQQIDSLPVIAPASAPFDLFTILGVTQTAKVNGTKDIADMGALDTSAFIVPGLTDSFQIKVGSAAAVTMTIGAGDDATDLVNTINASFPGLASLSATGRLVLSATQDIVITDVTLGADGLGALGLTAGTTAAQDPSFTLQLDDGTVTNIPITSTDTSTQLLAKLNAIAGVNAGLTSGNRLQITTDFGAKIKLVDGVGNLLAALGTTASDIPHTAFRTANLGPGADITSSVNGADTLISYGQRVVSTQANEAATISLSHDSTETYRATLEQQNLNDSGVNLDEEMANLIAVQQLYGANAKMIGATTKMLEQLLAVI